MTSWCCLSLPRGGWLVVGVAPQDAAVCHCHAAPKATIPKCSQCWSVKYLNPPARILPTSPPVWLWQNVPYLAIKHDRKGLVT